MGNLSADQVSQLFELQASQSLFEDLIRRLYSSILRDGDVAIDGGAHGGLHTIPMAELVGGQGRIYAFEPLPDIAQWLRNLTRSYEQVTVIEKALSDGSGTTNFYRVKDELVLSSMFRRELGRPVAMETIHVDQFRLDQLAQVPVKFIKLDLEGGEYHAIRGGKQLVRRQRPAVVFECGGVDAARTAGYTESEFWRLWDGAEYGLFDIFGRTFGASEFATPQSKYLIPHYVVAAPIGGPNVANLLEGFVAEALRGKA